MSTMSCFLKLSSEVLVKIFSFFSAKTLLNISETCKWLKDFVLESDCLWKRLCFEDFVVFLKVKGPFESFFAIYRALYKYDVVQEQIYKDKCQLTFYCDVFNLPDYLYHWCTLLNKCSGHWPLSRTILMKEKFKKMWGLQDADLSELPPDGSGVHIIPCDYCGSRGFIWEDGLDTSVLKHGHIKDFHEVALKRCKKSVKRIENKFSTAARILRVRKLLSFLDTKDYRKIKNLVIREDRHLSAEVYFDEEVEDVDELLGTCIRLPRYCILADPCRFGVDYVRGFLHRTGFQQIINFSDFCKDFMAKSGALPQLTKEDVKLCTLFVYKKLRFKAAEKLISPKQFRKCARNYLERIDEVWEWQCEEGEEHQKEYRGQEVKSHQYYKNYVESGEENEFGALIIYFDGIEKLKNWLKENKWIEEIVKPQIINIIHGSLPEEMPSDPEERAMYKLVRQYLKTGKTEDFNKTLLKLSKISKRYLKAHKENVRKLEQSIPVPLRLKAMKSGRF